MNQGLKVIDYQAVYFDSDMIITDSLEEFWTMSLDGCDVAVVPDLPVVPEGVNCYIYFKKGKKY